MENEIPAPAGFAARRIAQKESYMNYEQAIGGVSVLPVGNAAPAPDTLRACLNRTLANIGHEITRLESIADAIGVPSVSTQAAGKAAPLPQQPDHVVFAACALERRVEELGSLASRIALTIGL